MTGSLSLEAETVSLPPFDANGAAQGIELNQGADALDVQ